MEIFFLKFNILQNTLIIAISIFFFGLSACQSKDLDPENRSLENALATFELEDGFQIELIAAEPLISDPVDMLIDEYGRMFVVEMHGYPLDLSGSGKIKMLTDTNGDGQMDKSVVFAENLMLPTGIMRWKDGLLVTDPPSVYYLADSNGDGKADIKETVLTGFAVSNPQHNVNTPRLGIDNWIYLGHEGAVTTVQYAEEFGDRGNEIYFPKNPEQSRLPQNALGRSVRFRPETHELEMLSSKTQFGHTWNAYGHRFLVNNNDHIIQDVLKAKYLKRNPYLLVSNATESISDHGNAAEVFPITKNPEHQLLTDVGVMTSACGILSYTGGTFPEGYDKAVFVAEPVSNLVHMDVLEENGVLYTAKRKHPDKEFLASTDAWFRPVNHYIGPDGALYVVDYYRQIIEHPEWMAEEVVQSGALYNGTDQGRIYRISPKGTAPISWSNNINLGDVSLEDLVEKLADPNSWWRMHAQRLLVDRIGENPLSSLVQMAQNTEKPLGKLHALWTLQGIGQMREDLIRAALKDPTPGIRENAIRLAELNLLDFPGLEHDLLLMVNEDNAMVRFQLLCTLGDFTSQEANQARQALLFRDIEEEWMQVAALSADGTSDDLLASVLAKFDLEIPAYASLVQKLSGRSAASQGKTQISDLLKKATSKENQIWQTPLLTGLSEGLKTREELVNYWPEGQNTLINAAFNHPSIEVRKASVNALRVFKLTQTKELEEGMQKATDLAKNRQMQEAERVIGIQFLGLSTPVDHQDLLESLLDSGEPFPVQSAALQVLNRINDPRVAEFILAKWPSLTPSIRDQAISSLLTNAYKSNLLLAALEEGLVQKNEIGWERTVRLMNHHDEKIKKRARDILAQPREHRADVIEKYQVALELQGSKLQGKTVYENNCMICHKMGDKVGFAFGPDLASLRNRRHINLMEDILDPNLSIADGYDLWSIELHSGEQLQGVIASETPMAIRLLNAAGVDKTIGRQDIKNLRVLEISAMPMGLEENISPQEMADLLAFIKQE